MTFPLKELAPKGLLLPSNLDGLELEFSKIYSRELRNQRVKISLKKVALVLTFLELPQADLATSCGLGVLGLRGPAHREGPISNSAPSPSCRGGGWGVSGCI